MTDRLAAALLEFARGSIPVTIGLSRLLADCTSDAEARQALAAATAQSPAPSRAATRLQALAALWAQHPDARATVRSTLERLDGGSGRRFEVADWARAFDRVVEGSPEASVAIYSLGSRQLLNAATDEVVTWMTGSGLLGRERDGLDLGCGIGRFLIALAPHLRSLVGIDISSGMVAEARRRCAAVPNVRVAQGSGHALELVPDRSVDLVLASDVFPYLVDVGNGLVERHLGDCSRVLRPHGHLLILNFAYAGSDDDHVAALSGSVDSIGLHLVRQAERPFRQWDAAVYLLERR